VLIHWSKVALKVTMQQCSHMDKR